LKRLGWWQVAVPANTVRAKDTTGAGDLFTAGFLSAFLAGLPLDACARTGCFMGAQVVQVCAATTRITPSGSWLSGGATPPARCTPR
jgi:sugar/nucleoside kinase (ribokinase family)